MSVEIGRTPELERRERVAALAALAAAEIRVEAEDRDRAQTLVALRFGAFDALHVACAERGGVDVLLTTDDRLIKRAARHAALLRVRVRNPVSWLGEEGIIP